MGSSFNQNFGSDNSHFGTIKRSSSRQKDENSDRPSTAPSKFDKHENERNNLKINPSMKRLPSPNIKCIITY